jgi:flagellar hook protein FlgE
MGFQQGLSGLNVAAKTLDVIGNNIANAAVAGFKSSTTQFGDLYADSLGGTGGVPVGIGALVQSVSQQFTQGNITNTNNPLDVAIHGQGFFRLENNGLITYSRNGQFHLANDGTIQNASGNKLTGLSSNALGIFPLGATPSPIVIDSGQIAPKITSKMQIELNLNSTAKILNPAAFDATDPTTYTNSTSGTVYDSKGAQHTVTMYFVQNGKSNELAMATPTAFAAGTDDITSGDMHINGVSIGAITGATSATLQATAVAAAINAENIPGVTASVDLGKVKLLSTINPLNIELSGSAKLANTGLTAGPSGYTTYVTVDGVLGVATNAAAASAPSATGSIASGITINGKAVNALTYTAGGLPAQSAAIVAAINASSISGVTATVDADNKVIVKSNLNPLHIQLDGTVATAANTGLLGTLNTDANFAPVKSGGVTVAGDTAGRAQLNFDTSGKLITPITGLQVSVDLNGIGTLNNPKSPLDFSLDLTKATSFANPFGVTALTQDGYSSGKLSNFAVGDDGVVQGHYSNGQAKALGQIVLVNFKSVNGLKSDGANQWKETVESGQPLIGVPGTSSFGNLQSSAVEDSNVDLTTQLVNMITAQRIYQANAQSIKTHDQILQTLVNLR